MCFSLFLFFFFFKLVVVSVSSFTIQALSSFCEHFLQNFSSFYHSLSPVRVSLWLIWFLCSSLIESVRRQDTAQKIAQQGKMRFSHAKNEVEKARDEDIESSLYGSEGSEFPGRNTSPWMRKILNNLPSALKVSWYLWLFLSFSLYFFLFFLFFLHIFVFLFRSLIDFAIYSLG
jgi:hypothetical protein